MKKCGIGAKYLTHYKAHCQKFQNSNNSNRSEFKGTQLFSIQKKQIFVINKCTVLKNCKFEYNYISVCNKDMQKFQGILAPV